MGVKHKIFCLLRFLNFFFLLLKCVIVILTMEALIPFIKGGNKEWPFFASFAGLALFLKISIFFLIVLL